VPDRVANRQPPEKSPDARPVLAGSR
jgi:hypothetical protein